MAESLREKNLKNNGPVVKNENLAILECAVCLQTSVHPAELPCGHVFCYLCIKGIVSQDRRCAMCRQDIPVDYLDKPRLLKPVDVENSCKGFEDGHLWFYEGHNGWWQYDERTSLELESAYQKGERCCELLIAGFLYIADFDTMLQYRRNDPCRRRRIKRDLATISSKGVAGLKTSKNSNSLASNTDDSELNGSIPDLQSLQVSGMPLQSHLTVSNTFPVLPSLNSLDSNQLGTVQSNERSISRSLSTVLPQNVCSAASSNNSNLQSPNEDSGPLSICNFELDDVIHDTLNWTIEQIEALNLELTNDYENLFHCVNNSNQSHNALDANRSAVSANNSSRHSNESSCALPARIQTASRSNCSERNVFLTSRLTSQELITPSETNERLQIDSTLPIGGDSNSLSRSRETSRLRCRKITPSQF